MSEEKNIVIDNGSGVIKAGFSGDNQPSVKFPLNPEEGAGFVMA